MRWPFLLVATALGLLWAGRAAASEPQTAGPKASRPAKETPSPAEGFLRMEVRGVLALGEGIAVLLSPAGEAAMVPIFIGDAEARAIRGRLAREAPVRPLTHDLLENVIRALGGKLAKVEIDDLRADVFLGRVYLEQDGRIIQLDARPSDAIALALGLDAPIFASRKVVARAGVKPGKNPGEKAMAGDL